MKRGMKRYTREFSKIVKLAEEDEDIKKALRDYDRYFSNIFELMKAITKYYEDHPDKKHEFFEE